MSLSGRLGGIDKALYVIAGFVLILGILNVTTIKNYPEERGCYPDNDPNSPKREEMVLHIGWTWKSVLKVKELWLIAIGNGILAIPTFAIVTTIVPTMLMKGYDENTGLLCLTLFAILGFIGSYAFGWLDQKWGTKKAVILACILTLVGIACFFLPGGAIWVFVVINACLSGATSNFPLSMTAQVFGRDGSQVAFPVMCVIKNAVLAFSYGIMGQSLVHFGSYDAGWILIGVLVIVCIVVVAVCNLSPKTDPIDEV